MGVELLHAVGRTDGRTGIMKLIMAFCNFAKAPKTYIQTTVSEGGKISCTPNST